MFDRDLVLVPIPDVHGIFAWEEPLRRSRLVCGHDQVPLGSLSRSHDAQHRYDRVDGVALQKLGGPLDVFVIDDNKFGAIGGMRCG